MNCLKCRQPIENTGSAQYGLHTECFTQSFGTPTQAEFTSLQRRSSASSGNSHASTAPHNNRFFHGKFKKYSAELGGESYILMMRQSEAPELPEVEYLCNQIGKTLGITLADFYLESGNMLKETKKRRVFVGELTSDKKKEIYEFIYDKNYTNSINAIPISSDNTTRHCSSV